MTTWPRSSRIAMGRSTFSHAVAEVRSGAWMRSGTPLPWRATSRDARPSDGQALAKIFPLDHLAAGAAVDRMAQGLHVGLFRPPLDEHGEAPLREAMRRRDHRLAPVVLARFHFSYHPRAVLGIDAAVALHPDLREPDAVDRARLLVAKLDGHPDAANVVVAVMRKRVLTGQEPLHRGQRDPADGARRRTLEEPQRHPALRLLGHTRSLSWSGEQRLAKRPGCRSMNSQTLAFSSSFARSGVPRGGFACARLAQARAGRCVPAQKIAAAGVPPAKTASTDHRCGLFA